MKMEKFPKKLLDQMREAIRRKYYSSRTEKSCTHRVKRFILFHDKRHPPGNGQCRSGSISYSPGRSGNVAASTQNQVLSALLFPYREVLHEQLDGLSNQIKKVLFVLTKAPKSGTMLLNS
jgi:hypothetical protein